MPSLLQQPANYSEHVVAQLQPVGKPDVESFDRIAGLHDIGAAQNAAEPLTKVLLPMLAFHTISPAYTFTELVFKHRPRLNFANA